MTVASKSKSRYIFTFERWRECGICMYGMVLDVGGVLQCTAVGRYVDSNDQLWLEVGDTDYGLDT